MEKSINYATRPLWFWNKRPTPESIRELMENCAKKSGYAGFGVLPYDACGLEYMGEEYLSFYGVVLKEAKRLGLKICLYDEWWFPSGSAGGLLKKRYPEACAKRLDMEEYTSDNGTFDITIPQNGKLMAAVALKGEKRTDLAPYISGERLKWRAPESGYSALLFILRDSGWDRVDYLSPEAVEKFIACTHGAYYARFKEYFGTVIDSAFYDEPQFYGAEGRMWTEKFNDRFFEKYGEPAATYYPALFFDIGEETARARNMLFSVRADLYAEGFPGTVQKWCTEHGIALTGHVDQEEVENPCGMTGDLMKSFKYQDIPGVDEVFQEGRASAVYKVVSSAAVNWDKRLVMCECFGAMHTLPKEAMYRESFDLYTKGVNFLVPHAVWMSGKEEDGMFPPELSYREPYYGPILPEFNEFCARTASRLQISGQVNSVAILYPIESLQYTYSLNWEGHPYYGGPTCEKNNYLRAGQHLIRELNCDFTFLHPEVLEERCVIEGGRLVLKSDMHFQRYSVVIIPGMKAMSFKTLEKLKRFAESGGTLVALSELPEYAVEKGKKAELNALTEGMFGPGQIGMQVRKRQVGKGVCYALPWYYEKDKLKEIIGGAVLDTNVLTCVSGLQYIHKRAETDVWFFAAITEDAETRVKLEGEFNLSYKDPFTGKEGETPARVNGGFTEFTLELQKEKALLIEGKRRV